MSRKALIKLPGNFDETLADLLKVKPPPKPERKKAEAPRKGKRKGKADR